MKKELLSPVGDMESLYQAVFNGCDAVYLACKNFGARKFATNFTNDEIIDAIKFCHLYGVKIYVTMNTLVKNEEVESFISQARFLHENGVDALIVQDFGMICLLREVFPNLEIHASTQANTSSLETCQMFYRLGVKRVVFSRELSLDEIEAIDVPIEKEIFIHGALCISYSGCCLMSSMLGGRSGNRGECAGCCRMPFTLIKDDQVLASHKYLLSTKELNTTNMFDKLMKSSIFSFKIEGRMKSPLYVGFITRFYRDLIDGRDVDFDILTKQLKTIFNREFTKGRLFNVGDQELMNTSSPNHIGLFVGNSFVCKDKIKIILGKDQVLNQYDAIRFLNSKKGMIINYLYDSKGKLCNSATDICYVDNKIGLIKDDLVHKTQDVLLEKEYKNISTKKIDISIKVKALLGKPFYVELSDGINIVFLEGEIVSEAIKLPVTREVIIEKLGRLGESPFECNMFDVEMDDNIFIQMKALNDIRRKLVAKLIDVRENVKKEVIENSVSFNKLEENEKSFDISCFIFNKEQLDVCLKFGVSRIYINDKKLYEQYKDFSNVYLAVDRCSYHMKERLASRSFVSDYFDFSNYNNIMGNYSLNVTNIYTAYFLKKMGLKNIPLSVELDDREISDFTQLYNENFGYGNFEILGYGRVENMLIKGNVLNLEKNYFNYQLIDMKKRVFPVFYDGINTHILNYECRSIICPKISNCTIRLDFYQEDKLTVENIIKKFIN